MTRNQIIHMVAAYTEQFAHTHARAIKALDKLNESGDVDAHDRSKLHVDADGAVRIDGTESRLGEIIRMQSIRDTCATMEEVLVDILRRARGSFVPRGGAHTLLETDGRCPACRRTIE